jgi:hypothetical protein
VWHICKLFFSQWLCTKEHPECDTGIGTYLSARVGKVTLKSKGDETSSLFFKKSNCDEAFNDDFL